MKQSNKSTNWSRPTAFVFGTPTWGVFGPVMKLKEPFNQAVPFTLIWRTPNNSNKVFNAPFRVHGPTLLPWNHFFGFSTVLSSVFVDNLFLKVFAMVVLHSTDPAQNRFREYSLDVQEGLFETWTIFVHWGRIGTRGQAQEYLHETLDDAIRQANTILLKRYRNRYEVLETDPFLRHLLGLAA